MDRAFPLTQKTTIPAKENFARELEQRDSARLISFRLGEYRTILAEQERLHAERVADRIADSWLVGEHPLVITQGVRAAESDLPMPETPAASAPVFQIDRGGMTTLHSPGQLIVYPIVKVNGGSLAAGRFSRALVQAFRIWIVEEFGVRTEIHERQPGLYVGEEKLLSVGISLRHGVSMHGVAVNFRNDLSLWKGMVACGESGLRSTSLSLLLRKDLRPADQVPSLARWLRDVWSYARVETLGFP